MTDPDQLDEDDLREFLASRLVAYKLPRTIELVDTPCATTPARSAAPPYEPNASPSS